MGGSASTPRPVTPTAPTDTHQYMAGKEKGTGYNLNTKPYEKNVQGYMDNMGTMNKDFHAATQGNYFGGLDRSFAGAGDNLSASLAARGMGNSGIYAKSMGDLAQQQARSGSEMGVQAYQDALGQSDNVRNNQLANEHSRFGNLVNNASSIRSSLASRANAAAAAAASRANSAAAAQTASNRLDFDKEQAAFHNTLATTNARNSSLNTYTNVGQNVKTESNNQQQAAASNYNALSGLSGKQAYQIAQSQYEYNKSMQQAQAQSDQGKGSMIGTVAGAAGTAIASDRRLKDNIHKVGELGDLNIYVWSWNEAGEIIAGNTPTIGFIAQEVEELYPQHVIKNDSSGYLKINYEDLIKEVRNG